MTLVARRAYEARIDRLFASHPVVGLVGPRQCGKTTLAREYGRHQRGPGGAPVTHFDLEDPADLALLEHPKLALEGLSGLVVIDEVQRRPDLFAVLRVLVDAAPRRRFLVLGSASPALLQQGSESLAGRLAFVELPPFTVAEAKNLERLWLRGGYPRSYLARNESESLDWREAYISTFVERDAYQLGFNIPSLQLRRLWQMLAHHHGQTLNTSELGRSLQVSHTTIRRHLDLLAGAYMMRELPSWHENIRKRQVKAPKLYVRDSGLLHALLGCDARAQLLRHPKLGASWEGFALEAVLRLFDAAHDEAYFWATQNDAELDLLLMQRGKRHGFEIKYTDAPRLTRSMHVALVDLALDSLTVVVPAGKVGRLADRVRVMPLPDLIAERAAGGPRRSKRG
jgi:predicted AAA+ superfamily ATPase